jgi:hypothetical protein
MVFFQSCFNTRVSSGSRPDRLLITRQSADARRFARAVQKTAMPSLLTTADEVIE